MSRVAGLQDISRRETLFLALLAGAVLLLGLWPAPLFELMETTLNPPGAAYLTIQDHDDDADHC